MVNREEIRFGVGILGNIISLGLFLSPVPTFIQIIKKKSVQNFKSDPYLATILNCAMWVFYGMPFVHPDSLLVITINTAGFFLEIVYVIIFFIYSPFSKCKKMIIILLVEAIFLVVVISCVLKFIHGTASRTMFVGAICVALNILMYASPLTAMRRVIRTKSVKYMPFTLSFANLANGIVWLLYASIKFDPWIAVPNGLGALSGILQLVLYAMYYRSTDWSQDSSTNDSDLELPRTVQL